MSISNRVVWPLAAAGLLVLSSVGYAQDKQQFREKAKAAEAQLRALGEPKDRCSIGGYVAAGAVVSRTFTASGLMPGDRLLTVNRLDVAGKPGEDVIALLRSIDPSAVVPISLERAGKPLNIEVACSNARQATEALLAGLNLASRGKFDECFTAFSQPSEFGTQGAALKADCASLSRNASKHNVPELRVEAMRMQIEDAHWIVSGRAEVIERLRANEGWITEHLGAARFTELVAATRAWPNGEDLYDTSTPDWALFRRNAETALRARLIDPDSARIDWPYGFLRGSWRPFLSKRIDGYWSCGSINARNRMGGYTGSTSFVVVLDPNGRVQYSDVGTSKDVDIVTSQCSNAVKLLPPAPAALVATNNDRPTSAPSLADELKKLVDLKNSGALSDTEFQTAKQRLLGTSGH